MFVKKWKHIVFVELR